MWVQFPLSLFKLCILQTNFIHPPTSPPLFHPLSSMTPFLKSASSKPGRWSNPRNLLPGKPVCGFNSHSAPLIFCTSNFYPTTPTSPPLFPPSWSSPQCLQTSASSSLCSLPGVGKSTMTIMVLPLSENPLPGNAMTIHTLPPHSPLLSTLSNLLFRLVSVFGFRLCVDPHPPSQTFCPASPSNAIGQ